jgi:hypothetical protein
VQHILLRCGGTALERAQIVADVQSLLPPAMVSYLGAPGMHGDRWTSALLDGPVDDPRVPHHDFYGVGRKSARGLLAALAPSLRQGAVDVLRARRELVRALAPSLRAVAISCAQQSDNFQP